MKSEIGYQEFSKSRGKFPDEHKKVSALARRLSDHLKNDELCSAIRKVHKPGGQSKQIQGLLLKMLLGEGFESERKRLFAKSSVRSVTPDYYRKIGKSGVIVEIERGKTIANNMDVLDLWKCHLCKEAHFLFLVVPLERKSRNGLVTRPFERVSKRLSPFFQRENYVNVEAVYLFGY